MNTKNIVEESKTQKHKLTKSDRSLLRSFFGYNEVKNFHAGVKKKKDASIFTKASLWSDSEDEQEGDNNEKTRPPPPLAPYELSSLVNEDGVNSIPTIFPLRLHELEELFTHGASMNNIEEASVIRSFQVSMYVSVCIY